MIVMKFGGTSVADAASMSRTISIVESKLSQRPVVVVSACAKVTDTLYEIIELDHQGKKEEALELAAALRKRHEGIVADFNGEKDASLAAIKETIASIFSRMEKLVKDNNG